MNDMDAKEQLRALRERIDEIDKQLILLFKERMDVSLRAADVKVSGNMPIQDVSREKVVVERAVTLAGEGIQRETALLMHSLIALSREYQRSRVCREETPFLPPAREPLKHGITCVFQGVPGAWSEQALIKLFPEASRINVDFFEDVFLAVKDGRANYGVAAIENSQTGAIGETYDLLKKYDCFIVGRTWLDIRQCLLASPGTALSGIREVYSHPEGFKQCGRFLHGRGWDLTACRNTAVAAEIVAKANDARTAAIGSRRAAEVNGLSVLAPDVMDSGNNRTSFVVIAAEPEYDEKSELTSVTFSTRHRAGALCETLMPFMARGINLLRIESRPNGQDSYRFFAELEGNILDTDVLFALKQSAAACEYFKVIGCYSGS
jgi:chorismate mutase/prephenate dehydratase